MTYRAPLAEYRFLLQHVLGFTRVTDTPRFADATADTVEAVLAEAAKLCETDLAPLQRSGDKHPARLENGIVRTSPGFAEGYRALADGGFMAIAASPEHGGLGLPMAVTSAVNEMIGSACMALQLNPLMTQGQIEALEHHASDELKALYIPKLVSGEWCGTMNLTEPQAGSDVGALRTKAEPLGDGTYAISGQKIFITWGDNDFTGNIVHLVLARLPDGGKGTKGISLFIVPKFIPDAAGNPGRRNSLQVVSLEHKLGLHGSPTCVMQYDGAQGWLVGEPHHGMEAMFTMMNNARLCVAVQGVAIAEAAYQSALAYAQGRKQGRTSVEGGAGTIIEHADVRRMLAEMKRETISARCIALMCAVAIDMAHATGSEEWEARAALLTPIAKAFGTDTGIWVADQGVQVHGGMGFIEETGAAQHYRDARILTIYEGTTAIQANDLIGRKTVRDGGRTGMAMVGQVRETVEALPRDGDLGAIRAKLVEGADALEAAIAWFVAQGKGDPRTTYAGSVPFLMLCGTVLAGWQLARAALRATELLAAGGEDPAFLKAKIGTARFYADHVLSRAGAHRAAIVDGAAGTLALEDAMF